MIRASHIPKHGNTKPVDHRHLPPAERKPPVDLFTGRRAINLLYLVKKALGRSFFGKTQENG